jgi:fructokinase
MLLGSIEAGGTKFVCAIGTEDGKILDRITILTRTPDETIPEVIAFFRKEKIGALGIGSFGPIDVKKNSPTYGHILKTPKLPWQNYPFLQTLQDALEVPCGFTTDVNAAVLGEYVYGAGKDADSCLYVTVGTGIGAGAVFRGELLEGMSHPEMGHIIVRKSPDDPFEGVCPFHRDCLEGLASGPAIEKRWGRKGAELADEKKVWELEAYYLAQAVVQYTMILMPEKIIIGGGVSNQAAIFPLIRRHVREMINGYITAPAVDEKISDYIVSPGLRGDSGIVGGLVLAKRALEQAG